MKLKLLIAFVVLLSALFFLEYTKRSQPTLSLENRCPLETEEPSFHFGPLKAPIQPNGWRRYQQADLGFVFDVPGDGWFARQSTIQEFEEQLVFPRIEYSLYFSFPVDNCNPLQWEKEQKAALHFMVFSRHCQSLEAWLGFIPGSEKAQKEEIKIDGRRGIRLRKLPGYQADELIVFEQGDYHYQFRLQVKFPEDSPHYSEQLAQIIDTFEFIEPGE